MIVKMGQDSLWRDYLEWRDKELPGLSEVAKQNRNICHVGGVCVGEGEKRQL